MPIETFGVVARWDEAVDILDIWASIQMPNYVGASCLYSDSLNSVRLHQNVDVGGSYGVKRGIKHGVIVGYLVKTSKHPFDLSKTAACQYG